MYAIIQFEYPDVFGTGETPEEAINDSRVWLDDGQMELEELEETIKSITPYDHKNTVMGEIYVIPCTEDMIAKVESDGGGYIVFDINDNGVAYLPNAHDW